MNGRIYRHACKDCETVFYVEDLSIVGAAACPKCNGKCIYIDEHKIEQQNRQLGDLGRRSTTRIRG